MKRANPKRFATTPKQAAKRKPNGPGLLDWRALAEPKASSPAVKVKTP